MDNEFKELTKANLPSGSMNSGKIIKGAKVKVANSSRTISNASTKVEATPESSNRPDKNKENQFTIEPKYNEDIIEELSVSCSCGNNTRIVFNKEEDSTKIENSEDIPNLEEVPVSEE